MAQKDEKQQAQQAAEARGTEDLKENEGYRYETRRDPETDAPITEKITFKVDPKTGLEAN